MGLENQLGISNRRVIVYSLLTRLWAVTDSLGHHPRRRNTHLNMVLADLGARLHGALNQLSRAAVVDDKVGHTP